MARGVFFHTPELGECWICGDRGKPSREHKIKASDLRRHFGTEKLSVFGGGEDSPYIRNAQSAQSTHLKFRRPICERCNTHATQYADRAYDVLIDAVEQSDGSQDGMDAAASALLRNPFTPAASATFRYFGKLLGCHIAEAEAPIPARISAFVLGSNRINCIHLAVRADERYEQLSQLIPEPMNYAAHGGLAIVTQRSDYAVTRFVSTLSVGATKFQFEFHTNPFERLALRLNHARYAERFAQIAQDSPMREVDRARFGWSDTSSQEL